MKLHKFTHHNNDSNDSYINYHNHNYNYKSSIHDPYLRFQIEKKIAKKERIYIKRIEYYQRKSDKYRIKYEMLMGQPYKQGSDVYITKLHNCSSEEGQNIGNEHQNKKRNEKRNEKLNEKRNEERKQKEEQKEEQKSNETSVINNKKCSLFKSNRHLNTSLASNKQNCDNNKSINKSGDKITDNKSSNKIVATTNEDNNNNKRSTSKIKRSTSFTTTDTNTINNSIEIDQFVDL